MGGKDQPQSGSLQNTLLPKRSLERLPPGRQLLCPGCHGASAGCSKGKQTAQTSSAGASHGRLGSATTPSPRGARSAPEGAAQPGAARRGSGKSTRAPEQMMHIPCPAHAARAHASAATLERSPRPRSWKCRSLKPGNLLGLGRERERGAKKERRGRASGGGARSPATALRGVTR